MFLHTPRYLLFLLVAVIGFWALPKIRGRKLFLLSVSYFFYFSFEIWFLVLLLILTIVVFLIGRAIPNSPRAKSLMWGGILVNLGILSAFKFSDFFLPSLEKIGDFLGGNFSFTALQILLPIGISFYTFQGISYIVEIYRGKLQPATSFIDFALYLAFFPKLIAGPFMRPAQFFEQLGQISTIPGSRIIQQAFNLLLLGLFKKLVIADSLTVLSHTAFRAAELDTLGEFSSPLFIQGFYLYAIQIYADFSGYTDLARASAMLFGFTLPENFRQPYLAGTISEFWNRWHMTLTQWFRDYLFNPITRAFLKQTNRKYPLIMQIITNLITMLLIGLWHGASWTFIAWGLWHGILLSLERVFNIKPVRPWQALCYGILSFHLIGIGWVLFAAQTFTGAYHFLKGLFSFSQMIWLGRYIWPVFLAGGLMFSIDLVASGKWPVAPHLKNRIKPILMIATFVVILGLWLLSAARGEDTRPFIYGQF